MEQRLHLVWGPAPRGSEEPLLCVLLPSILHFHYSGSLFTSSSPFLWCFLIIAAAQDRQICQRGVKKSALGPSDGLPSTGAGQDGNKGESPHHTTKKHSREAAPSGKCV